MVRVHPSFPNPTIHEALCEIHFLLQAESQVVRSLQGEFYKSIQPDFPDMEPTALIPFQLQVEPAGVQQRIMAAQQRMRYTHRERPLLLQLSPNILTVNELATYPGWLSMKRDVLYAWQKLIEIETPLRVTRIGLRYINRIERTHPDEIPDSWLKASSYIPAYALSSCPGFLYRLQAVPDPGERLVLTLGEMEAIGSGNKPIVLDIDRIVERDISVDSQSIDREIERLHDCVWDVFDASMAPRLRILLEGGSP